MVLEPNFTKVVSSARKNLGITQSIVEVKLPTNEDAINNIYSVSANSTILSYEVTSKSLEFTGVVDFQAIYDSVGIAGVDYTAEFKDKFDLLSDVVGEIVITSNVIDVTSSIVSSGIKINAIVEIIIDEITSKDVSVLTNVRGEYSYTSIKDIEYSSYIGKVSERIEATQEFEVKNVNKVLMITPKVCLGSVECRENYLIVSGVVDIDVCCLGDKEDWDLINHNHTIEFTSEVALDGINDKSILHNQLSILYNEIKLSSTVDDGGLTISVYVPVNYTAYVFNRNSLPVIDDLYSATNYLSITSENFETLVGKNSIKFKDNVSGSASISETSPFIDDILGVCANNIVLASSIISDDKLFVEGIANSTVVYYTKETNSITSIEVEMPFSVEEKVDGKDAYVVTICLKELSARSKRGKEIEVSGELNVYADISSLAEENVISNLVVGDEKPNDDCSLYVYIVRPNQTLWDIAKDMNISEEMILEQNEGLELPLRGGERLVIYRPKVFGFDK